MIKVDNIEVWGFEHALRGMRNPYESWDKSDSGLVWKENENGEDEQVFKIGENDLKLAQSLIRAGSEHRKFLRQIFCSVDITAPLYWWKEFDTYKVGTVSNSTSTMHKLASTPIAIDCFEMDDFAKEIVDVRSVTDGTKSSSISQIWEKLIDDLETLRCFYNATKDKRYWKELIRLLPESWLQKRTITMNYENILNMVRQRSNHKLSEWSKSFIEWAKTLPYAEELIFIDGGKE